MIAGRIYLPKSAIMKKGKIILGITALLLLACGIVSLSANKRERSNLYTSSTIPCKTLVFCSTEDQGQGNGPYTMALYTKSSGTCKVYTGSKFFASSL